MTAVSLAVPQLTESRFVSPATLTKSPPGPPSITSAPGPPCILSPWPRGGCLASRHCRRTFCRDHILLTSCPSRRSPSSCQGHWRLSGCRYRRCLLRWHPARPLPSTEAPGFSPGASLTFSCVSLPPRLAFPLRHLIVVAAARR